MQDVITFQNRSIKMTFGLLNRLCRVVGEIDGAAVMSMDNDIREMVLVEVLSPRDAEGAIPEGQAINVFNIDASPTEVAVLLDWVQEQVISFFVNRASKTREVTEPLAKLVSDLKAISPGGAT